MLSPNEIECLCPSGWPRRIRRDYGVEARGHAQTWQVPEPSFEVLAHTGVCRRSDEVVAPGWDQVRPTASVS